MDEERTPLAELARRLERLEQEVARWRRTARQVSFRLRYSEQRPRLRMLCTFDLELTDRAWDTLGLNNEERAFVDAYPSRPGGFVAEKWGESFTRWQVFERKQGERSPRWTVDAFPQDEGMPHIILWEAPLSDATSARSARVRLEWIDAGDGGVRLGVIGGRFGPDPGTFDEFMRDENILLRLPLPLCDGVLASHHSPHLRELNRFLVPGDQYPRDPGLDIYARSDPDKGFEWTLSRYDFRPLLWGSVTRIGTNDAGALADLRIRLGEARRHVRASALALEPADEGESALTLGRLVWVVLGEDYTPQRIWLGVS